jgi:hypothetical protein
MRLLRRTLVVCVILFIAYLAMFEALEVFPLAESVLAALGLAIGHSCVWLGWVGLFGLLREWQARW